jgi:hypothetical protein
MTGNKENEYAQCALPNDVYTIYKSLTNTKVSLWKHMQNNHGYEHAFAAGLHFAAPVQ